MKKKRGCFCLLFILLFVGGMHFSYASGDEEYDLSFQLDGQEYNINIKDLAEQNQISLEEYPYYMIGKNTYGELSIYYGKGRITCRKYSNPEKYRLYNNDLVYRITIKEDGTTVQQVWDLSQSAIYMYKEEGYIGANHDIFCDGERIFVRNHGYVYDVSKESKEEDNEVVKIKSETKVYEYPAINYNELVTLPIGNVVKRIKKAVNEINGHIWDKVILSDGREGYVFSDSLEVTEEYSNIEFEYKGENYNVYFSPEDLEINIEEYPYYLIGENTYGELSIYYSKSRITGSKQKNTENYRLYNASNESVCRVTIEKNGFVIVQLWNFLENATYINKMERYVKVNHDIFTGEIPLFIRNHGYEYDLNNESEEEVEEIVKTKVEIEVYEYPAINYNELVTLPVGNVVKRIKKAVNEINGHIWDKVILSDGREGYMFSDSLELVEGYSNIEFEYKGENYNVYFSPEDLEINIEEYPYYLIGENTYGELSIYYSKSRIICSKHRTTGNYRLYNSNNEPVLRVGVNETGEITQQMWDFIERANYMNKDKITGYIGANHDICDGDAIIFNACIYDEIGNIGYTTGGSWDDIKPDSSAYAIAKQGEEEYDSMPMLERISIEGTLITTKEMLYTGLISIEDMYTNAAPAIIYFLTKGEDGKTDYEYAYEEDIYTTGHKMRKISFLTAINESMSMKEKLVNNIKSIKNIAEKICIDENTPITFYNIVEDTGAAEKRENSTEKEVDWFLTLHNYRIKMECTAIRVQNNYKLKIKYGLVDYYDWKVLEKKEYEELFNNIEGVILDDVSGYLELMHKAGVSRNYTNYGEITFDITWSK